MNTFIKNIIVWVAITLMVLVIMVLVSLVPSYQSIAHLVQDSVTHNMQFQHNTHNDNIVILKIDDTTLDAQRRSDLGMLTIDKWFYATIIEKLFEDYWVWSIWFDIVFANPSILGEEDDVKLQNTLEKYKDKVVLATRGDMNPYPLCYYSWVPHGAIEKPNQDVIRSFNIQFDNYDLESVCSEHSIHEWNKWSIESLSYRLFNISFPIFSPLKRQDLENQRDNFYDMQGWYLSYFSNGKENEQTFWFRSYSLIDIYEQKDIDLQNKIILIWEVGTLIHDSHITPISRTVAMPWVEINANIIETLYQWKILRDISLWYILLLSFLIAGYLYYLTFYQRFAISILGFVIVVIFILIFSMRSFSHHDLMVPMFNLIVWSTLYFILLHLYKYIIIDKARRNLKKQFSLYVAPDVVDDISNNPNSVILEWEEKDMTIFFSDIVNFTSISESTPANRLLKVLNEYFTQMTYIIHHNKWTLDKYIWDAVMCFYWAPLTLENHAYYACKTALEQQNKLKELRDKWRVENLPNIQIRIGIHSWKAIHWNIWSSDTRLNYTIIGDNVNLASRLEALCKEYQISICVSEEVFKRQKDNFHMRELDMIQVKGKQQAVKIYELIAPKTLQLSKEEIYKYTTYIKGLKHYRLWDYYKAQEIWIWNTSDSVSLYMSERCSKILKGEAVLRNNVYIMQHK